MPFRCNDEDGENSWLTDLMAPSSDMAPSSNMAPLSKIAPLQTTAVIGNDANKSAAIVASDSSSSTSYSSSSFQSEVVSETSMTTSTMTDATRSERLSSLNGKLKDIEQKIRTIQVL